MFIAGVNPKVIEEYCQGAVSQVTPKAVDVVFTHPSTTTSTTTRAVNQLPERSLTAQEKREIAEQVANMLQLDKNAWGADLPGTMWESVQKRVDEHTGFIDEVRDRTDRGHEHLRSQIEKLQERLAHAERKFQDTLVAQGDVMKQFRHDFMKECQDNLDRCKECLRLSEKKVHAPESMLKQEVAVHTAPQQPLPRSEPIPMVARRVESINPVNKPVPVIPMFMLKDRNKNIIQHAIAVSGGILTTAHSFNECAFVTDSHGKDRAIPEGAKYNASEVGEDLVYCKMYFGEPSVKLTRFHEPVQGMRVGVFDQVNGNLSMGYVMSVQMRSFTHDLSTMQGTCGAPIVDENGRIVGIHNADKSAVIVGDAALKFFRGLDEAYIAGSRARVESQKTAPPKERRSAFSGEVRKLYSGSRGPVRSRFDF